MRQQINLYQTTAGAAGTVLGAKTVATGLLVLAIGLLSMWAFGLHQVDRLQQQMVSLAQQQQTQQQFMDAMAAQRSATATQTPAQDLAAQVQQLQRELSDRRSALALLHSGVAGQAGGFTAKLEALARRHIDGVWLDHITLASDVGIASLRGGSINADLVPRYLQALSADAALSGSRFDEFGIEDIKPTKDDIDVAVAARTTSEVRTGIRFHVTNTASQDKPQDTSKEGRS